MKFITKAQSQTGKIEAYLENIPLPKLNNEQTLVVKVPGNDGLFKEFYECFRDEIKKQFLTSILKAFLNQELSSSQKQGVIKMLEKKGKEIH